MSEDNEKLDALHNLVAKDLKEYGSGMAYLPGDIKLANHVPYGIPSGIPQLDLAISRPGLPMGRIIEYYGFEGSGKTTAAYHAMAQCQRSGGSCYFIDTESSFDADRASNCGVDPDKNLLIGEADTVEAIFRHHDSVLENLTKVGWNKPFMFVTDSVTAVPTEEEAEKALTGVERVGTEAKAIRRGVRLIWKRVGKLKVSAIFINHATAKINKMGFGRDRQAAGGHTLKFAASLRCEFLALGNITEEKTEDGEKTKRRLGAKTKIIIEKLKGSSLYYPTFDIDLLNDGGFDFRGSLLQAMEDCGIVKHKKSSQYYTDDDGNSFTKRQFCENLENPASFGAAYDAFYRDAIAKGAMKPYILQPLEEAAPEGEE